MNQLRVRVSVGVPYLALRFSKGRGLTGLAGSSVKKVIGSMVYRYRVFRRRCCKPGPTFPDVPGPGRPVVLTRSLLIHWIGAIMFLTAQESMCTFSMFCLAVTSRCMVYHLEIGWLHVPTTPEPGRGISEGTVVVWTIFRSFGHIWGAQDPLLRWVEPLGLSVRFFSRHQRQGVDC